jgi:hypothetical protein
MPVAKFVKDNLVLVVGLTLPVLLMAGFLLASALPGRMADPPRHDLLFSTSEYPNPPIPITVRLVVKDQVLTAQYTRLPVPAGGYPNGTWKKLYRYQASSGTVRELSFGFPADMDSVTGTREEVVEAAKGLRLDTTRQAPDGYELAFGDRRGGGLLLEIFGGSRDYEPRLRKGGRSVAIPPLDGQPPFGYNGIEFVGWVTGGN